MNEALLSSKNLSWCTPADFFAELDREFHFDLDPAATDKSAKCARYFTPADDGLKMDWGGSRVFCNPPYGRQIGDWVQKGYEESQKPGTLVVMLIPSRTDTSYFHDYILHGKADEIRFLRGRLKFTDEDGNAKDAAPFPSAVIVWRSPDMAQSVKDNGAGADPGRGHDGERDRGRSGWQRCESEPQRRGPDPHQSAGSRKSNKRRKAGVQRDGALRYRLEGRKRGINESNNNMAAVGLSYSLRR